jgi:hypothetical protein
MDYHNNMNKINNNKSQSDLRFVESEMIEVIQSFPTHREVKHCNTTFSVSPFDFYGVCPICKSEIKLRASSALYEIEDLFDAVFEWLINPEAEKAFRKRQEEIIKDIDEG